MSTPGLQPEPKATRPNRVPLGTTNRRLSFERRLRLWLLALLLPTLVLAALLLYTAHIAFIPSALVLLLLALAALIAASSFVDQVVRPLQTLANVVAALREDDFSFRARGARRGDSLGDLALEINALAATLQSQRSSALEALTLVERVVGSMQSPVLAFDHESRLRLYNAAAERLFTLTGASRQSPIGRTAEELHLTSLLAVNDQELYPAAPATNTADEGDLRVSGGPRFSVRRTAFRLRGEPHTLLVLADVAAALREEERQAWQRLIRVLGHEINNSLTPIKSIAATLRSRIPSSESIPVEDTSRPEGDSQSDAPTRHHPPQHLPADNLRDLSRGLAVIEDRAASLNRFLEAYRQLSTLPPPRLQPVPLAPLLERIALLETRLPVLVQPGPAATLLADPDQLQQVFINLIQNAADAALEAAATTHTRAAAPTVEIAWQLGATGSPHAAVTITDNGLGLLNPVNLFVPFYTTKPTGSGIGLALAKQILTAHQATLTLTNRPEAQGCIAELCLPLAPESPSA